MTNKEIKYKDSINKVLFFVKQMDYLGLKRKYTGYYQLADILQFMINENHIVTSFSKQVYPIVSEKYNKPQWVIERNIRNLIDKCWNEEMKNKLKEFWPKDEKPSCCEFIIIVKQYIENQFI